MYLTNDEYDLFKQQLPAVIVRAGESVFVEVGGLKRVGVGFDLTVGEMLRLYDVGGMALSVVNLFGSIPRRSAANLESRYAFQTF
ncbi:MAG: hypothetical protein FWF94_03255 [Oscillospiraceae bacterium]|nr:hypothetical protein [Oscillospiraceae bacterium]